MEKCVFCQIVSGEIPSTKEYEDESILGFRDIKPSAPVHVVMIPKKHISSLNETNDSEAGILGEIQIACRNTAKKLNIQNGYKIVINNGHFQEVPHIHYHLLGGLEKGGI